MAPMIRFWPSAHHVFFASLLLAMGWVGDAVAQYPDVHEEPFHQPMYGWDCLRFLNVRAAPGDTTALHVHRNPILYLTVSGTEVWLDEPGQEPRVQALRTGWVGSHAHSANDTLVHRFAVTGPDPLHILAIERLEGCTRLDLPLEKPFYEGAGFAVYAIGWGTYVNRGYVNRFPVVIPPAPILMPGGATYSAGHVLRPVDKGYAHAHGVEVVWIALPTVW